MDDDALIQFAQGFADLTLKTINEALQRKNEALQKESEALQKEIEANDQTIKGLEAKVKSQAEYSAKLGDELKK